jgi:hypothetical protein
MYRLFPLLMTSFYLETITFTSTVVARSLFGSFSSALPMMPLQTFTFHVEPFPDNVNIILKVPAVSQHVSPLRQ